MRGKLYRAFPLSQCSLVKQIYKCSHSFLKIEFDVFCGQCYAFYGLKLLLFVIS
jgi:hypothetical protein